MKKHVPPPIPQENGVDFVEPFKHISWRDPSGDPFACLVKRRSPRRWDIIPWHKISSRCGSRRDSKSNFSNGSFLRWKMTMGVFPKIGRPPHKKRMVYYNGKAQSKMDDLGVYTPIFGNTQIEKQIWGVLQSQHFFCFEAIWNLENWKHFNFGWWGNCCFWESIIVESSWTFHVLGKSIWFIFVLEEWRNWEDVAGNRLKKSSNILVVNLPTQDISQIFCWDGDFGEGPFTFRLFSWLLDKKARFRLRSFCAGISCGMFFQQDQ